MTPGHRVATEPVVPIAGPTEPPAGLDPTTRAVMTTVAAGPSAASPRYTHGRRLSGAAAESFKRTLKKANRLSSSIFTDSPARITTEKETREPSSDDSIPTSESLEPGLAELIPIYNYFSRQESKLYSESYLLKLDDLDTSMSAQDCF